MKLHENEKLRFMIKQKQKKNKKNCQYVINKCNYVGNHTYMYILYVCKYGKKILISVFIRFCDFFSKSK